MAWYLFRFSVVRLHSVYPIIWYYFSLLSYSYYCCYYYRFVFGFNARTGCIVCWFFGPRSKIPLISILIYSCFNCDARSLRRKWNISVGPVYLCGWPDAALFSVLHRYTSELRFLPAQPWVAESNDQQQQNNIEHLFIHFSINRSPNIWCFCLYYWPCCTSALLNKTYRSMHFTVVTTILLPARWAVL